MNILTKWVKQSKFIKRASFALVGRNLVMLRAKGDFWADPEFATSTGNSNIGVNSTSQPPVTRIFGANLNITF